MPIDTPRPQDYVQVAQLPDYLPGLFDSREAAMWTYRQRRENGMERAFTKLGKKLICHIPTLLRLLDEQREQAT